MQSSAHKYKTIRKLEMFRTYLGVFQVCMRTILAVESDTRGLGGNAIHCPSIEYHLWRPRKTIMLNGRHHRIVLSCETPPAVFPILIGVCKEKFSINLNSVIIYEHYYLNLPQINKSVTINHILTINCNLRGFFFVTERIIISYNQLLQEWSRFYFMSLTYDD